MGILDSLKNLVSSEKVDYIERIAQGAVVIDVRSPQEFKQGHAKGSINIPLDVLPQNAPNYKGREVVVVCRSGMRSHQAKTMFQKLGITAHNAGAWQNI